MDPVPVPPPNKITVLIADDHSHVREGLCVLLAQEADLEVVGEAENGHQAVALASTLCPDVIIMDISMPLLDGLAATLEILYTTSNCRILVLSSHGDESYIQQVLALGVSGYLLKEGAAKVLPSAVRAVHSRSASFWLNPPPLASG